MDKKKLGWITFFFILLGCSFASIWLTDLSAEQLLFNLHVSLKGVNNNAVWHCLLFACSCSAGILVVVLALLRFLRDKRPQARLVRWVEKALLHRRTTIAAALLLCFLCVNYNLEFIDFVRHQMIVTTIYQNEYVEPKAVQYQFPEKKRNLIYIFLESMEVTYTNANEGGAQPADLIPELRGMAQENVNFSPNEGFGGSHTLPGTTWTMAAMVGQTSGLPLKLPFDGEKYYGDYSKMLPGAWTLGDILEQEGYQQVVMMGSDSSFAGRGDYFSQHGNYEINDYNTALEDGRLPADYHEWWGYEDRKLFEYAKAELLRLAASDQPFNLTMLTVDTHFEDGYVCPLCPDYNKEQYANVIRCSSHQVSEFVKWIQEQDFYENTTIVISGDHLSMDSNFFNKLDDAYDRQVYNCIINPAVENPTAYTKNRLFTTLDMFPTTLAALGVTFAGDRLALGTNLFSGVPTLAEEMGLDELSEQLSRNSNYYNYHFLYTN